MSLPVESRRRPRLAHVTVTGTTRARDQNKVKEDDIPMVEHSFALKKEGHSPCKKRLNAKKPSLITLDKYLNAVKSFKDLEIYCPGCGKKRKLCDFRVEAKDADVRKDIAFARCRKCRSSICLDPYVGLRISREEANFVLRCWARGQTTGEIRETLQGMKKNICRSTILRVVRKFSPMLYDYAIHFLKPKTTGEEVVMDDMRIDLTREYEPYHVANGLLPYRAREVWVSNIFDDGSLCSGMYLGFGISPDRMDASHEAARRTADFIGFLPRKKPRYDGCPEHRKALKVYIPLDRHDSKTKTEDISISNKAEGPQEVLRKMGCEKRRFRNLGSIEVHFMLVWFFYNYVFKHKYEDGERIPAIRAGIPFPELGPDLLLDYWIQHAYVYMLSKGIFFHVRRGTKLEDIGNPKSRFYQTQFY